MREELIGYRYKDEEIDGYACFDEKGECTQFVIFRYDVRYPSWRDVTPFDGQPWLAAIRDDYLLKRLLTASGYYFNR